MKTNGTFYCAVDWVKVHGYDFWKQFDEATWAAAKKYVEMLGEGYTKSEAAAYVRKHF